MASDLDKKIVTQLEYYFGDINLPRDKFLKEQIKADEGWVTLETLLTFKRLASLSSDAEVIANAVEKSESNLLHLSEDKKKIRRNPEDIVPEFNDERKKELIQRSAYAKGFPLEETMPDILDFLEPYGPVESVIKRNRDNKFKGSCFIIFKDVETAKKFVEIEGLKYKDAELIRKMQTDYHADKKKEIEERKLAKKNKKEAIEEQAIGKLPEFPKGAILHFAGIPEDKSLTREEIKEKLGAVGLELAHVDYNKGDTSGYARFSKEGLASEFLKKATDDKFTLGDVTLSLRVLEGDEESEYLKKTSEAIIKIRQRNKQNSRKRKGNFNSGGGGGRNAKHQRRNHDKHEKKEGKEEKNEGKKEVKGDATNGKKDD